MLKLLLISITKSFTKNEDLEDVNYEIKEDSVVGKSNIRTPKIQILVVPNC